MVAIAKRFKAAVVDKDGNILEAAGLVIDCGDGVEQVITSLITPRLQVVEMPLLDDDGRAMAETVPVPMMIDTAVPLVEMVQDAGEFQAAVDRYAAAYMAGKAVEAITRPLVIEPSAEVAALLSEK